MVTPVQSSIKFDVKASVAIDGTFDKWTASLKFPSRDVTTGILDIRIDAASVNTGSGMKDGKLKGKDFFDVEQIPILRSNPPSVQTGPTTFDVTGNFTIRGVSRPETLHVTITGKGTGSGTIKGIMAFDRRITG